MSRDQDVANTAMSPIFCRFGDITFQYDEGDITAWHKWTGKIERTYNPILGPFSEQKEAYRMMPAARRAFAAYLCKNRHLSEQVKP